MRHRHNLMMIRCRSLVAAAMVFTLWALAGSLRAADPGFALRMEPRSGQVTSLRRGGDTNGVEFLRSGRALGAVWLRVRSVLNPPTPGLGGGGWREIWSSTNGVVVRSGFRSEGEVLWWEIGVTNTGAEPLEIGDLALPLPMNTEYVWDHDETFRRRVFRHAFIAGHGSFLYWLPAGGSGPVLVMAPGAGTALEYFTATGMDYAFGREQFTVFVHAGASAEIERRGSWRQPRTARVLAPGEGMRSRMAFRWADDLAGVRDLLRRTGGVNVEVTPGMVVPRDLSATLALQTTQALAVVEAEHPGETRVERLGRRGAAGDLYRVTFARLGENRLTVRGVGGWSMPLEFFVTEPLETLVKKRAAFIVQHQQHRDPAKWYDGLYSLWDRRQPDGWNLLGPDHLAGQHVYAVSGSDDPSNGKALLVAEKNVAFPDAAEVASLEYFVSRFVWGRHQRTDREQPYPYGIYGADSWHQNRLATRDPVEQGISRPGGPSASRMWRTFDYTTYFALYFNLYRIAKQRPDLVRGLDAAGYLERAYGTARAYFEVPAQLRMEGGWSFTGWVYWQYTVGNFHEKYLVPLIEALEREGHRDKADHLRGEWEKKVKYFIYDHPWPFASEMPIDSTAYESTYAAGRYALEWGLRPDTNLWHDRNLGRWYSHPAIDEARHREFLRRQHRANLACRGAMAPHYWSLGSDYRGCGAASYTLSYMSQMGGWAVLDYGLRFLGPADAERAPTVRLGYASLLSSWALMNSGDAASGHGYWTPGARHDGAMSWGFQPRQVGTEWNPAVRDHPRGAWPVCGEADHGLVAGIEAAVTVLMDDPVFGLTALGGVVNGTALAGAGAGGGEGRGEGGRGVRAFIAVVPRDGVRQRFHAVLGRERLEVSLDRDGFAAERAIRVTPGLDEMVFEVESRSPAAHEMTMTVGGWPAGRHGVETGGRWREFQVEAGRAARVSIAVPGGGDSSGTKVTLRRGPVAAAPGRAAEN